MRITRQILGTAAVGALALFGLPGRAQAQLIDFHGGALACFYTGSIACDPLASPSGFDIHAGATGTIDYSVDTFTGTASVPGSASFSDTPCSSGPPFFTPLPNCGSFGHIHVSSTYTSPADLHIALMLLFNTDYTTVGFLNTPATPTVVSAGQPRTQSLAITGFVTGGTFSGVTVTWDPVSVNFSFTNGGHLASCIGGAPVCGPGPLAGVATWLLGSPTAVALDGSPGGAVTGNIAVSSVSPEPATIALFATGLMGLIPVVRYRRRNNA